VTADTIVACATPTGGALAIVRLSGPKVRSISVSLLGEPPLTPKRATRRAAAFGGRGHLDDVVAVLSLGPLSFTGEDELELTCHGAAPVVRALLDACVELGCRLAEPGEFTRRAFLNGKLDLAQAEAVADLGRARTDAARRAALSRLSGGLSRRVEAARDPLFSLLAEVEARLDHPDEELPPVPPATVLSVLEDARDAVESLLAGEKRGRLLRDGARVGLFGRPNAGKSSLMNALLRRDRAIVSPTPGTTRDVLEESVVLGGMPAVLIDTAGLRDGGDEVETEGIRRAETELSDCDVAVLVHDSTLPGSEADILLDQAMSVRKGRPTLRVWNKTDLQVPPSAGGVHISAKTGAGLDALEAAVSSAAGLFDHEEAPACGARQVEALNAALAELDAAAPVAARPELLAARLRAAVARLGELLGEGAGEDVLDAVFSRFCLGK
jgi:tRNA modification GTPase